MKRQLTGKATKNIHGVVNRTALRQMGLTANQAEVLSRVIKTAPSNTCW
jgi:hypothetical protein